MKNKTIKAWAHLNEKKNKIISISIGRSKPTWLYLGTWQFEADPKLMVPCEITYTLPLK